MSSSQSFTDDIETHRTYIPNKNMETPADISLKSGLIQNP